MAFENKIDIVGIQSISGVPIALRSNAQNKTNSVLQIPGANGSFLGDEQFGHIGNPTCEYAITGPGTISFVLGQAYNPPYALSRVSISTGAGQEPVITADAVQIETGQTQTLCVYTTDSLSISPARHALDFGAFTYPESISLTLQNSTWEASVNLSPATINGRPVASDSTAGMETVSVTMWSSSETTAPSVTVGDGWTQTADWTCTGADSSMFVWTATFTKYLTVTT